MNVACCNTSTCGQTIRGKRFKIVSSVTDGKTTTARQWRLVCITGQMQTESVDLQKVVMLPRMPGVKSPVFTRRLTAYHETFAAVGKKNRRKTLSVVWHEGVGTPEK